MVAVDQVDSRGGGRLHAAVPRQHVTRHAGAGNVHNYQMLFYFYFILNPS